MRIWKLRGNKLPMSHPALAAQIMGILNITPDSFSDGGALTGGGSVADLQAVAERALSMVESGAAVLDVGGQSTRPGFTEIGAEEEWRRIELVISALVDLRARVASDPCKATPFFISVDTFYPFVAEKALKCGADIINDVTGFSDPLMIEAAAQFKAGCVVTHSGDITSIDSPDGIISAVREFFLSRTKSLTSRGVPLESICLDCGIGFGKTRGQEVTLIERMGECRVHDLPILAAASRKRVVAHLAGGFLPFGERDELTHKVHRRAVEAGADMVRVHDVAGAARSLHL